LSIVDETAHELPVKPEQLAWGVMLLSFAAFCIVFLVATIALYNFLFESTVPMQTILRVGRGTVGITDAELIPRVVRTEEDLTNRTAVISTDSQSQSTISYRLPESEGSRLIAAITVKQGTSASLRRATLPRFDWSNVGYEIIVRDLEGEIDILITGETQNPFLLSLQDINGQTLHFLRKGRYRVTANGTLLEVVNREGEVVLFSKDLTEARIIPSGRRAIVLQDRNDVILTNARENLLENGLFVLSENIQEVEQSVSLPARWGCTNLQDSLPRGSYNLEYGDGRSSIRLLRAEGASSHGETRCKQPFPEPGAYVGDYNYLELTAAFYINFQSLSECGIAGSECPMMMMMEYTDMDGNEWRWVQGFYTNDDLQIDYPLRLGESSQDHQKINEKVWYTFETGNLFSILSPEQQPEYINNIEFYASGHQYDVFVSEIAMLVGINETIPPQVIEVSETPQAE